MQRHKMVARIILLILSAVNFALAAPVSVRGIRGVRVDAMVVAKDVATASRKRWNPSDKRRRWPMNAADGSNTPLSPGSSDSGSRSSPAGSESPPPADNNFPSPMDIDSTPPASPQPSPGSTNQDSPLHSPVGSPASPPPAHYGSPLSVDIGRISPHRPSQGPIDWDNLFSFHADSPASPPPAHGSWPSPMDIDPNSPLSRQSSLGSTNSDNSHSLSVGPVPMDIDLIAPQPSLESTNADNSNHSPVDSPPAAHNNMDLNAIPHVSLGSTDSGSAPPVRPQPSLDSELTDLDNSHPLLLGPPPPVHDNSPLSIDVNALPQLSQESIESPDSDSHSTGSTELGSFHRPAGFETSSDVMTYPWQWHDANAWVTWEYPSSSPSPDSSPPPRLRLTYGNLGEDTNHLPSSPRPSDDQRQPAALPPPETGQFREPYVPSDSAPSTASWEYLPLPEPPTRLPTWAGPQPLPGSSTPDPPSSPRPQPEENRAVYLFSELFKSSRFERRISHSRPANAE